MLYFLIIPTAESFFKVPILAYLLERPLLTDKLLDLIIAIPIFLSEDFREYGGRFDEVIFIYLQGANHQDLTNARQCVALAKN